MDAVGTDVQLLSPRPYLMLNGRARWADIRSWVWDQNDTIAQTIPRLMQEVGNIDGACNDEPEPHDHAKPRRLPQRRRRRFRCFQRVGLID